MVQLLDCMIYEYLRIVSSYYTSSSRILYKLIANEALRKLFFVENIPIKEHIDGQVWIVSYLTLTLKNY